MKIVYITAKTPFDAQETFVLTELLALKELGIDLLIIPRDREKKIFNKEAESLIDITLSIPWFNLRIVLALLRFMFTRPLQFLDLLNVVVFKARNAKVGFKNLIILPKALYLCKFIKKESISHIHAHWASTTSTMAYIISRVTGVPWSFTAHRWDIPENNILKQKCVTASFIRAIDKKGSEEIRQIINDASLAQKILVIHMGVFLPKFDNRPCFKKRFTFLCPANFVLKKGHKYLFESCKILAEKGLKFKCLLAGDGPLKDKLRELVQKLNLTHSVEFLGRLPHEQLFDLYKSRRINAVILPSIVTDDGEKEGIPVALMEAMSYGIPVISTNTGGIPELIGDGSGIMVEEKNSEALASAIQELMKNKSYYALMSERARGKIEKDFNMSDISEQLLRLFSEIYCG